MKAQLKPVNPSKGVSSRAEHGAIELVRPWSWAVNLTYGGREETLVVTPLESPDSCPHGSYLRTSPLPASVLDARSNAATFEAGGGSEGGGGGSDEWCELCPAGTAFMRVAATAASAAAAPPNDNNITAATTADAAEVPIVGLMACVMCPEGFVSGPGAVRCVSCGSVYNSNAEKTACEVRWYVYLGGSLAVAAVAFTFATAQTLFRFGNRQVERIMMQAREARRLQREREKRKRERAVKKKVKAMGQSDYNNDGGSDGLGGGGGGGGGDGDDDDFDDDDDDEDIAAENAVKKEVAMTLDMVGRCRLTPD